MKRERLDESAEEIVKFCEHHDITDFQEVLQLAFNKSKSRNDLRDYAQALSEFADFLRENAVTPDRFEKWAEGIKPRPFSGSSGGEAH